MRPAFIEKGSPQQNPYVERFNGTMPDEVLRGEDFDSVLEARVVLNAWVEDTTAIVPTAASACSHHDSSPPAGKRGPNETHSPRIARTSQPPTVAQPSPHPAGCLDRTDPHKKWTKPRGPVMVSLRSPRTYSVGGHNRS